MLLQYFSSNIILRTEMLTTRFSLNPTFTFPIMHLICHPQKLHNLCFSFLLGYYSLPKRNKVHYEKCGSGVWKKLVPANISFCRSIILRSARSNSHKSFVPNGILVKHSLLYITIQLDFTI